MSITISPDPHSSDDGLPYRVGLDGDDWFEELAVNLTAEEAVSLVVGAKHSTAWIMQRIFPWDA